MNPIDINAEACRAKALAWHEAHAEAAILADQIAALNAARTERLNARDRAAVELAAVIWPATPDASPRGKSGDRLAVEVDANPPRALIVTHAGWEHDGSVSVTVATAFIV